MHPGPSIAGLAGLSATVGPYAYRLGEELGVVNLPGLLPQPWVLILGCSALFVGGLTMNARRVWDQWVLTAGVALIAASLAPALTDRPGLALTVMLASSALILQAWLSDAPFQLRTHASIPSRADLAGAAARWAVVTAAVAETTLLLSFAKPTPWQGFLGFLVATTFVFRWATTAHESRPRAVSAVAVASVVSIILFWAWSPPAAHVLLLGVVLALVPADSRIGLSGNPIVTLYQHPAGPLATSFFLLCAAGSLLLMAPAASTTPGSISLIDAVFTSVSAVCVTGLIVLDTPNAFSGIGQGLILLLIQIGALGIMIYSAAILITLGKRLGLRGEAAIASGLSPADRGRLHFVLKRLIIFTFICEAAGAAVLTALFRFEGDSLPQAVWRGLFTSISAFCNAGFALQSDNLVPYQLNPGVLHTVAMLIILGGLSPAAALAVPGFLRGKERRAQVKIVLTMTALLLGADFVLIAGIEWNGLLAGLPFADKLHNAWFQSVTLRTAGFNSVPLEAAQPATLILMMLAMFIGGSPGGTAGGVKTTTAAVMVLSVLTAIRGRHEATIFGRTIPVSTVNRAAAIATLGLLTLFTTALSLLLTQAVPAGAAVFEAVSALGTVGLSIGATAALDEVGKIVVIVAMFAGRVGPLSMFAFLSSRETRREMHHPVESIDVG